MSESTTLKDQENRQWHIVERAKAYAVAESMDADAYLDHVAQVLGHAQSIVLGFGFIDMTEIGLNADAAKAFHSDVVDSVEAITRAWYTVMNAIDPTTVKALRSGTLPGLNDESSMH